MPKVRRRGFSLSMILLVTAVLAVVCAALSPVWLDPRHEQAKPAAVGAGVGLVLGCCVGAGVGFHQTGRLRAAASGLLAGTLGGAAAGALLAVPRSLPTLAVGSLVLILFGVVVRLFSAQPPQGR